MQKQLVYVAFLVYLHCGLCHSVMHEFYGFSTNWQSNLQKVSLLLYSRDILLSPKLIVFEQMINGGQYIPYSI